MALHVYAFCIYLFHIVINGKRMMQRKWLKANFKNISIMDICMNTVLNPFLFYGEKGIKSKKN